MSCKKFRWFKLLLWEHNEVHMKILDFLRSDSNPYQGACIRHEPEQDEKFPHYHCVLYFPNPRTIEGVCSMFGKCNIVSLSDGTKKQTFDITGYDAEQVSICDCIRYLTYKVGNETKVADNSDIDKISDVRSWSDYLLHQDFKSRIAGKTLYNLTDIKPFHDDSVFLENMFEIDKTTSNGSEIRQLLKINHRQHHRY